MLGIPADMDEEESAAADKVASLPSKPQKTLITNFFKCKDVKQPLQKPKDLFGYFKRSTTEEEDNTKRIKVLEKHLDDSLDDFKEVPKKLCEEKPNPLEKKKIAEKKCEVREKSEREIKSVSKEDEEKNRSDYTKQNEVSNMEISYEDFLKSCHANGSGDPNGDSVIHLDKNVIGTKSTEKSDLNENKVVQVSQDKTNRLKCLKQESKTAKHAAKQKNKGPIEHQCDIVQKDDVSKESLPENTPNDTILICNDTQKLPQSERGIFSKGNKSANPSSDRKKKVEAPTIKADQKKDTQEKKSTSEKKSQGDDTPIQTVENKLKSKSGLLPEEGHSKDLPSNEDTEIKSEEKLVVPEKKPKPKGIAMFFKRIDVSEMKKKKREDSTVITTKAVVHHLPAESAGSSTEKTLARRRSKRVKSNVAVEGKDFDLSITQLGSEIIEIPEKKKRSPRRGSATGSTEDEEGVIKDAPEVTDKDNKSDVIVLGESPMEVDAQQQRTKEAETDQVIPSVVIDHDEQTATGDNDVVELTDEEKRSFEEKQKNEDIIKQRNLACIASLDCVSVVTSGNRKQATLSFTSKGLVMGKPLAPEPVKEPEKAETKESTETAIFSTPPKQKKVRTPCKPLLSMDEDVCVLESPPSNEKPSDSENRPLKRRSLRHVTSTPCSEADQQKTDDTESEKRAKKILNSVFKSSIISTPPGRKKMAIKLKFKRMKNPSSDEDFCSPKSKERQQKVNRAQKLLMKARTVKPKKGNKSPVKVTHPANRAVKKSTKKSRKQAPQTTEDSGSLRRSSRASAKVAQIAISTSFEEKTPLKLRKACPDEDEGGPKKSKTTKKSPKKGRADKKAPAKLASIFCKRKPQADPKSAIVISDEESEETEVDPEVQRIRKQFLMSGVPETLRRQQMETSLSGTDCDYPPFPTESHVRQEERIDNTEFNPWKLPLVSLNLRKDSSSDGPVRGQSWISGAFLEKASKQKTQNETRESTQIAPITKDALPYLLAEINRFNVAYPVRRVFKQLQKCRKDAQTDEPQIIIKEDDSTVNKEVAETKEPDAKIGKGRKRKNPDPEVTQDSGGRQSKRQRASTNEPTSRLSLRRSQRTASIQEEVEEVQVLQTEKEQDTPEPAPVTENKVKDDLTDNTARDMLWTEQYEPQLGGELLGNSGIVKRLKSWLVEWKQRTDLELRRARKKIVKQAKRAGRSREEIRKEIKKSLGADWWMDDDSDFELGTEDDDSEVEDEDECRLCNCTLLTGPHGVGKTALVYALAKELGYKVFEVNASSRRNGKQMLAQLQEATQSHQVSKKNLDSMFTTSMAAEAIVNQAPVPKKKMPTAFANLFGKAKPQPQPDVKSQSAGSKQPKTPKKGKQSKSSGKVLQAEKTAPKEMLDADVSKRGLDLSSTSLVLFEEVDIIFEEDKGFWAAIQTFMSTTKRPIILTSSEVSVSNPVEGQHEQLVMRTPPLANIATHLQLVCLAENLRTSFHDLRSLVEFHRGDLRRCLLTLQFWATSRPHAANPDMTPVKYHPHFLKPSQGDNQAGVTLFSPGRRLLTSATSQDSGSDFETTPVARRRRCVRNVIEDESSMDSIQNSPLRDRAVDVMGEDSQSPSVRKERTHVTSDLELVTAPNTITFPPLYRICHEALTFSHMMPSGVLPYLQERVRECASCDTSIFNHYHEHGFNLLYTNLSSLLGLPCCAPVRRPSAAVLSDQTKVRRRIKCAAELFASDEESDSDGFVSLKKPKLAAKDGSSQGKCSGDKTSTRTKMSSADSILLASITSLSDMYDAFSYADAELGLESELWEGRCNRNRHVISAGTLQPGLTNSVPHDVTRCDVTDATLVADAVSCTQLLGVAKCRRQVEKCVVRSEDLGADIREAVKEKLSLPQEGEELRLANEFSMYERLEARHQRAYQFVCTVLPLHVQLAKRAVATDYIPALQTICRTEQLRKSTNTKRRFLHYMDSISVPVTRKQHVLDTLCSSFI